MIEGHFENGLIKGKATFYPNNGIPYDINNEEEDLEDNNEDNEINNENELTRENTKSNFDSN